MKNLLELLAHIPHQKRMNELLGGNMSAVPCQPTLGKGSHRHWEKHESKMTAHSSC